MSVLILGIEASCDDTAIALIEEGKILANCVANQAVHEAYGGVVPELASRSHQKNIIPVLEAALKKSNRSLSEISAIAYTQGPGLIGSLLVGCSFAKGLSLALDKPLIGVNHMQAHILAHFIDDPKPSFPFLCLTVSGGHTQLVLVHDYLKMEVIGSTIDDAAGEAFDKSAKILGLPYPGGPLIDKHAKKGLVKFNFSKPKVGPLEFSYSGLKTSILYTIRDKVKEEENFIQDNLEDLCASIQFSIVDILIDKLKIAIKKTGVNQVAIAGGVSANSHLRERFAELGENLNIDTFIPAFEYCTDNAAMIAITAHYKFLKNDFIDLAEVPSARLKF